MTAAPAPSFTGILDVGERVGVGEMRYGAKYREALEFTGLDNGTLRNLNWVAGSVDLSRRRDALSFGHHQVVAPLEADEQEHWLGIAERDGLSVMALREAIRAARALPPDEANGTRVTLARLSLTVPEDRAERLELLGPCLAFGLTYREIAARVGRSEDWVSTRVALIRSALIAQALEHADELDARLRDRVEELAGVRA